MEYIFFTDLRSLQIVEAQKSFLRECSVSFAEATKKVVPKGAQCKFSAQKSFQRECRAKYRKIEGEEVQKTFLRGCRTYTEK
jgi:hypothetical protein